MLEIKDLNGVVIGMVDVGAAGVPPSVTIELLDSTSIPTMMLRKGGRSETFDLPDLFDYDPGTFPDNGGEAKEACGKAGGSTSIVVHGGTVNVHPTLS